MGGASSCPYHFNSNGWFGGLVAWWFGGLVVWWFGGLEGVMLTPEQSFGCPPPPNRTGLLRGST